MSEIHHKRLLASLFYLLFFTAGGAIFPYANLFYQSIGMTNNQIGVLAALSPMMVLVAAPLWSALADRLRLHRVLLPAVMIGSMIPPLLMATATDFWHLAGLMLLYTFFLAPIMSLADNAILSMLGADRHLYGSLRLWGAVGFGVSAWTVGQIANQWGLRVIFPIYSGAMLLTLLVALRLPVPPQLSASVSYLSSLKQVTANQRWLGFLAAVFLASVGYSMYDNFYGIYVKSLGAPESLLGVLFFVSTLSELPIFFFSPWLIRKLTLRGVITISLIAYVVRAIAYSLVTTPDHVIFIQLMHGLTYSALWTAAVIYTSQVTPAGLGASTQAILGVTFMGVSRIFGALIGSRLYDADPVVMFRVAAVIALTGLLVFVFSEQRASRKAET
jgi:PPP family 3-phenylpropionic acid transporter